MRLKSELRIWKIQLADNNLAWVEQILNKARDLGHTEVQNFKMHLKIFTSCYFGKKLADFMTDWCQKIICLDITGPGNGSFFKDAKSLDLPNLESLKLYVNCDSKEWVSGMIARHANMLKYLKLSIGGYCDFEVFGAEILKLEQKYQILKFLGY